MNHSFIVFGSAGIDTITHAETRLTQERIGGVAAICAQELARAGHQVTLHCRLTADQRGQHAANLLAKAGINPMPVHRARDHFHMHTTTKRGSPGKATGKFPFTYMNEREIKQALNDSPNADLVIADTNLSAESLEKLARICPNLLIIASTAGRAQAIAQIAALPKVALSMNRQEHGRIGQHTFMETLHHNHAQHLLITSGPQGFHHTTANGTQHHPAVSVPPNSDFIGCGDSAAAGLAHSIVTGEDTATYVARFIKQRLLFTADSK